MSLKTNWEMRLKRDDYLALLHRLPIYRPTADDFISMAVHIAFERVVAGFTPLQDRSRAFVAFPPLLLPDVIHYVEYDSEYSDLGGGLRVPSLLHNGAFKVLRHPGGDDETRHRYMAYPFQTDALLYAHLHWQERLHDVSYEGYVEFMIQDPGDQDSIGNPKTKQILYGASSVSWPALLASRGMLLTDETLVYVTAERFEGLELRNNSLPVFRAYICARCFGAIEEYCCLRCRASVRASTHRNHNVASLPTRAQKLVKEGLYCS